jgi:hypothetical protein
VCQRVESPLPIRVASHVHRNRHGTVYFRFVVIPADLRDEASAYVDPTFFIAPGVTDPGAYQFVFSEGIENSVSAVPEPPSGLLMLSGLVGMLGCFVRRT